MAELPRLFVFIISHYCEKALWACDRKGMRYQLVPLLPGLHLLGMRRWSRETHVPMLIDGSSIVQESSGIIDYLDAHYAGPALTPEDPMAAAESREWEALLDRELGETARVLYYHHALAAPGFLGAEYSRGGPPWGPWFYALALPFIRPAVARKYGITAHEAERALARLDALFERLDRHLATRRYLVGDRFSRADLTLAALAAGLIHPPEHPASKFPRKVPLPGWNEIGARFGNSITGERVRALYREERHLATTTDNAAGAAEPRVALA